jgi:ubiquinone/menaquinone biosynthesis C-methylase UbiE
MNQMEHHGAVVGNVRLVQSFHPGDSTATSLNVSYRLAKLQQRGLLTGRWLDFGCADGSYTVAMLDMGASSVVGVDVVEERVSEARAKHPSNPKIEFICTSTETLPIADNSFDGAFVNEVLEHVTDEVGALRELYRVIRPEGHLVIMSPNRGFPFECHGARIGRLELRYPVPILPWLPSKLSQRFMNARNYWPGEMRALVMQQGFSVVSIDFVWPVLDLYRWLPEQLRRWYQRHISQLDKTRVIRRLGLSVFLVAKKQVQ